MNQTQINSPVNDEELLARLKAGDPTACDACVHAHSDELYRLARRILGDEREAEDVVQETFFNAWKALDAFDGRARLGTWLFRIAYNNALMHLRKRGHIASLDIDDEDSLPLLEKVTAWSESPEELLERKETSDILDRAIDTLSEPLRAVFVLRDLEDRSTDETAQILQVSEQVVKTRLHRARLALRERLGEHWGAGEEPSGTMTCEQVAQYLSDYVDNDLDEPLKKQAEEHIATCNHCHILLDTTQKTLALYRQTKPRVLADDPRTQIYAQVQAAFKRRQSK